MEKAGDAITDAGKTVVDKITHPVETAKEIGEDLKELADASMGVNAYGTNVEGRADIKPVTVMTDKASDLADAGMGVNSYGNNVEGRADIKPVTAVTDKATDLADAGMGVNSYGTNVDMK
ncbi:hypothetical protein ACHAXT_005015 [Thalassiosira profunda]